MINVPTNIERSETLSALLQANARSCVKKNIVVQVDSINADRSVALCSVEQRLAGILRKQYSTNELVVLAERALSPLNVLGLIPLISVRHTSLNNTMIARPALCNRSWMDGITDLWAWLGYPLSGGGFRAIPVIRDPFGWRQAMNSAGH